MRDGRRNCIPAEHDVNTDLTSPHVGFHRTLGAFAGHHVSPSAEVLSAEE